MIKLNPIETLPDRADAVFLVYSDSCYLATISTFQDKRYVSYGDGSCQNYCCDESSELDYDNLKGWIFLYEIEEILKNAEVSDK